MKNLFVFLILTFFVISYGYADSTSVVEEISVSPDMKAKIMRSPFKANLSRSDGKKITAYIYAEDEQDTMEEIYSCTSAVPINQAIKTGHYYIYLYDISADLFFPNRTKIFDNDRYKIKFNTEGADIMVLSGAKRKTSDVLLVSQFQMCDANYFEAYGFSKNNLYLKNYEFVVDEPADWFYGKIVKDSGAGQLYAYQLDYERDRSEKMSIEMPYNIEKIFLKPPKS